MNDEHTAVASEQRLQNLETSLQEIHKLLSLIQTKLIGGLETDKPGIVNDLKNLQIKITALEEDITNIKLVYAKDFSLAVLGKKVDEVSAQIADLWKVTSKNSKIINMIIGGLIVINSLAAAYVILK